MPQLRMNADGAIAPVVRGAIFQDWLRAKVVRG